MRSRYTAFSLGRVDYVEQTMREEAFKGFDHKQLEERLKESSYLQLKILSHHEEKEWAVVEFIASFSVKGHSYKMHEKSFFKKIKGRWFYTKCMTSQFIDR